MNGNIYKVAPSITKEEILQNCDYEEIPDYGDVMSYKEFIEAVDNFCIIDYDGSGELILYDKVVKILLHGFSIRRYILQISFSYLLMFYIKLLVMI